jgi:hypothetical protein
MARRGIGEGLAGSGGRSTDDEVEEESCGKAQKKRREKEGGGKDGRRSMVGRSARRFLIVGGVNNLCRKQLESRKDTKASLLRAAVYLPAR